MTVFGLRLHPLIVHVTVVWVPTGAVAVVLAACWPWFRLWASWGPLGLALLSVALVPITMASGEPLEHALPHAQMIEQHAHLADGLLPWVIVLAVDTAGVSCRWRLGCGPDWGAAAVAAPDREGVRLASCVSDRPRLFGPFASPAGPSTTM
jgi:hypothetical protein